MASDLISFGYLCNLDVDYLKIEGTFVRYNAKDCIDYELVRTINSIGRIMNMKTIAEFVESEEVMQLTRDIGVDFIQGYLTGQPSPCLS